MCLYRSEKLKKHVRLLHKINFQGGEGKDQDDIYLAIYLCIYALILHDECIYYVWHTYINEIFKN